MFCIKYLDFQGITHWVLEERVVNMKTLIVTWVLCTSYVCTDEFPMPVIYFFP